MPLGYALNWKKKKKIKCYTSVRVFGSFRPIIGGGGRFVFGRFFRPRDVSDCL